MPLPDPVPLDVNTLLPLVLQGALLTEDAHRVADAAHGLDDPLEQAAVCGLAMLAIHDQRQTLRGVRALQTRVLSLTPDSMRGLRHESPLMVTCARLARVVATLYSEQPRLDLANEAEELIAHQGDAMDNEFVLPLRLYIARHLLGVPEIAASASLAERIDASAEIALTVLRGSAPEVQARTAYARDEWLAERAAVASIHLLRARATIESVEARIALLKNTGATTAFKKHRAQATVAGFRGDRVAEQRALDEFRASIPPEAAMPWLSYLRQRGEFESRCGGFVAAEALATEGIALAARIEAHPPMISAISLVQAVARWGQGHRTAAIASFDLAISTAVPAHARVMGAARSLLVAIDAWGRDRALARNALQEGLLVFREQSNYGYLSLLTGTAAEASALALAEGIEVEFVREVIGRRKLQPPSPQPVSWPWALRIFTFGGFRCDLPHDPETTSALKSRNKPARRPLNLLQWLAHVGPQGAERRNLIRLLWPGESIDAQVAAFEMALARLRKMLPEESLVVVENGTMRLDARRVWVDAWAFKSVAEQLAEGAPADADARLRVTDAARLANQLFAGRYLDGADESTVIRLEAEQHRERYIALQIQLANELAAVDQTAACALLMQAVEHEPYSERLYRALMACQAEAGEYAEAMRTFRRCQQAIYAAYGVALSPATVAIVERLPKA